MMAVRQNIKPNQAAKWKTKTDERLLEVFRCVKVVKYVLKSGGWRVDAGIDLIARIHQGNVPIAVSDTGRGSTHDDNKRNAPDVQF